MKPIKLCLAIALNISAYTLPVYTAAQERHVRNRNSLPVYMPVLQKCLEHDFVVVKKESECFDYAETLWEKELYKIEEKTCALYKSRRVISGENIHFRFNVSIGIYPDSSMAQTRLDSLRIKPQGLLAEEVKTFPLRAGFRCDRRVVILSTDVSSLKPHLMSLASDLEKCVCTSKDVPFL